jgi:hypothetical protein
LSNILEIIMGVVFSGPDPSIGSGEGTIYRHENGVLNRRETFWELIYLKMRVPYTSLYNISFKSDQLTSQTRTTILDPNSELPSRCDSLSSEAVAAQASL